MTTNLKQIQESIDNLSSNERSNLSDGYHTYNELYDMRLALTVALFNTLNNLFHFSDNDFIVCKSTNHSDGTKIEDN
jgi:hypothetical protein